MSYYVQQPTAGYVQQPVMQMPMRMQSPVQYMPMVGGAPMQYGVPQGYQLVQQQPKVETPQANAHIVTKETKATISNKELAGGNSKRMMAANSDDIIIRDVNGNKFRISGCPLTGGSKKLEEPLRTHDISTKERIIISKEPLGNDSKPVFSHEDLKLCGGKIITDRNGNKFVISSKKIHDNSVEIPGEKVKEPTRNFMTMDSVRKQIPQVPIVGGAMPYYQQPMYMAQPQPQSNLYYSSYTPQQPMLFAPRK